MSASLPEPTVSTALTRVLFRYVSDGGHSAEEICGRAGVDFDVAMDAEARLSGAEFEALWNEAGRCVNVSDFGLQFGLTMGRAMSGGNFLVQMMLNSPTVSEALDRFFRYHDIMADAICPRLSLHEHQAVFYWEYFEPGREMPPQLGEAMLCLGVNLLRRLTEDRVSVQEVRFTSPRPKEIALQERVFRAPLAFEQPRSELRLGREFLGLPIFLADGEVLETLEQYAVGLLDRLFASQMLSSQVVVLLGKLLARGEQVTVDRVAKGLALSTRGLQGKLKQEGTSYQSLLDDVRKKLAMSYLKRPDAAICDVAFLLGYSDQSAFNHAFKRWTGQAPREFQRS